MDQATVNLRMKEAISYPVLSGYFFLARFKDYSYTYH